MTPRLAPLALALLAAAPSAQVHEPGSALVYPLHRSGSFFTLVSVTNTHPQKAVNASFQYVNAAAGESLTTTACSTVHAFEPLTPADTVTRLTACHTGPWAKEGFLVVVARSPATGCNTSFDRLVGSELVVGPGGSVYTLTPYSFQAAVPADQCTDADFDGRPDFDGVEYVAAPDELYLDSFLAAARPRLVLFHLSTDQQQDVAVNMNVYNDNELPLSFTFSFRCWFEEPLDELSAGVSQAYLANTPNDPDEADLNCDGLGDAEAGWARIDAVVASSPFGSTPNPAILGAVTGGPGSLEGGRLLWGGGANANGEL